MIIWTRANKSSNDTGGENGEERINEPKFREVGDEGRITKKRGVKADT